jgi:4-deoxy-L-threo-5-hexosulose-uronate ketol-isomerase
MATPIDHSFRHAVDPRSAASMETEELRSHFHVGGLFRPGQVRLVYTHYDRMVVGSVAPGPEPLPLAPMRAMGTPGFLDRRELIAVNIGGPGRVTSGGVTHALANRDMLYIGMGAPEPSFASDDPAEPAKFYILSAPAHRTYETRLIRLADARRLELGSQATSNERTIHQFIHAGGPPTCQLVVGMTQLAPGSVWNTIPPHVHDRRMEAYLYFDLPPEARVFHFMGEPQQTRHIVMANEEAVISPPWSIHAGAGTSNYTFVWAMAGDNVDYTDIDPVALGDLR